jgi:TonB family protein
MGVSGTVIRWIGIGLGLGFGLIVAGADAQVLPLPDMRVQRQADSPLRWVLEASKLKARGRPAEPAATPPSRSVQPVARRGAPPALAALPAAIPAAVPAAALVPAAAPVSTAAVVPASTDLPAPAAPAAAADREPLELLSGEAPSLPEPMLADLASDAVLELAVIVLADGSVGSVTTLASTHPEVDEHAMAAVRAWRFKPGPEAQLRKLELVFHPAR